MHRRLCAQSASYSSVWQFRVQGERARPGDRGSPRIGSNPTLSGNIAIEGDGGCPLHRRVERLPKPACEAPWSVSAGERGARCSSGVGVVASTSTTWGSEEAEEERRAGTARGSERRCRKPTVGGNSPCFEWEKRVNHHGGEKETSGSSTESGGQANGRREAARSLRARPPDRFARAAAFLFGGRTAVFRRTFAETNRASAAHVANERRDSRA